MNKMIFALKEKLKLESVRVMPENLEGVHVEQKVSLMQLKDKLPGSYKAAIKAFQEHVVLGTQQQ